MSKRRIIVLDVEEARADDLVGALQKRDYVRVLKLDADGKEKLGACPACERKYPPPIVVKLTVPLVEVLIQMAVRAKFTKSVIFTNEDKPLSSVSHHEHPRCLEVDPRFIPWLEAFGFIKSYVDGRHSAYFLTKSGVDLLAGEEITPSRLTFAHGRMKPDNSPTALGRLKISDPIERDKFLTTAREAVSQISPAIRKFIEGGQVSLMV